MFILHYNKRKIRKTFHKLLYKLIKYTSNFERNGDNSQNEEEEEEEEETAEEGDEEKQCWNDDNSYGQKCLENEKMWNNAFNYKDQQYDDKGEAQDQEHEDDSRYSDWMYYDVPQCLKEVLCFAESANACERQVSCRVLLETLKLLAESPDDVEKLFQIIIKLSQDIEAYVIVELIEHIIPIARFCHEKEHLRYLIVDRLVPLLLKFLGASDFQVRRATLECLRVLRLQNLIDQEVIKRDICPVIVKLTYSSQSSPECFASAVGLMTKMGPVLGQEATEEFFVPRFVSLSMDSMANVRKMCVASFSEYCSAVSTQVTENVLLPCFVKLARDEVWEVRKACAEVIMSVSCVCRLESRKSTLAPVCAALLSDSMRLVRMAAFETLGPFITTFAEPSITGLAYNQHGQLVFTNWSGFEFRTMPKDDDRCRKYDEFYPEINENEFPSLMVGFDNVSNSDTDNSSVSSTLDNNSPSFSGNLNTSVAQSSEQLNNNFDDNKSGDNGNPNNNNINIYIADNTGDKEDDSFKQFNTFQYWREPIPTLDDLNIPTVSLSSSSVSSSVSTDGDVSDNNCNSIQSHNILKEEKEKYASTSVSGSSDFSNKLNSGDCNNSINVGKENKNETSQLVEMIVMQMSNDCLSSEFAKELSYKSMPSLSVPFSDSSSLIRQYMPLLKGLSIYRKKAVEKPRQNIVPQELIDHFVSLSDPIQGNSVDNRFLVYQIAYSLPAVAQTLGRENWSLLKNVYFRLAADKSWKVRRAVASSIHELAVIVGEDAATQDLVPVFNGIIKDLDDVRIGALKHLAIFLKTLRPVGRNSFLPKLAEFLMTDCDVNWRFREELAKQLLQMVGLFSAADTYTHLVPLAILLLLNKVAAVRQVALSLVTELVRWISSDVRLLNSILVELAEQFAHSKHWNRRQTFALLCSRLVSQNVLPEETFAINVLPHLLDLSWDSVPNVRLAVARTLSSDIAYNRYFSNPQSPHYEVVMQTLRRLQADRDRDVHYFAFSKPKNISSSASDDGTSQELP